MRAAKLAATTAALPFAATSAYLLGLLGAAAWGARRAAPAPEIADPAGPRRIAVLVPAHDEEAGIEAAVRALLATDYPPERRHVLVIADNCTDATAEVARRAGATAWERTDPGARGKGHALAWALDRLFREGPDVDVVAMVDADCVAAHDLLAEVDRAIAAGEAVVQADFVVGNPDEGPAAALRFAGYGLYNDVRARGKDALGLSAGLHGSGMAFRREVLERHPWSASSIAEDVEQHLELVAAGHRVAYLHHTSVTSPMPSTFAGSDSQQTRWESGRLGLVRTWFPRLVGEGLEQRDPVRLHAGLELLLLPQSLLALGNLAALGAALAARSRAAVALAGAGVAGQVVWVLGGLALLRAPASVWRALLLAPVLVAQKLRIVGRLRGGGTPAEFVRTER